MSKSSIATLSKSFIATFMHMQWTHTYNLNKLNNLTLTSTTIIIVTKLFKTPSQTLTLTRTSLHNILNSSPNFINSYKIIRKYFCVKPTPLERQFNYLQLSRLQLRPILYRSIPVFISNSGTETENYCDLRVVF